MNDILLASEVKQKEYLKKIDKIKQAIETFEEEDISIPESVYGLLEFYQSKYEKENNAYKKLIKINKLELITEDYVSFETAKLLKEKGFDEKCISVYHDGELQLVSSLGLFCSMGYDEQILTYTNSECKWSPIMISAPTLQMAMKWLREVHKIAINIGWSDVFEENYQWWCIILNQNTGEILRESEYHKTYEEACEMAIKYCLENLIN